MDLIEDRVVINVSGLRFETYLSTLERYPDTLLGSPRRREAYFDSMRCEYFFDRNRRAFDAILFYYQSYGRISKPSNVSERHFMNELTFFKIDKEYSTFADRVDRAILGEPLQAPGNRLQRFIWQLFDGETSLRARVITFIGILMLVISIILSCAESLPPIEHPKTDEELHIRKLVNIVNNACYIWFTIELILRFAGAVEKVRFFKSILNLIDLIAIIPFYLQLVIAWNSKMTSLSILRMFRLFRIVRLLKFSRYSRGIRALLFTLYASSHELTLLCFIIIISTVVSGAITYYVEMNNKSSFMTSIPESLWWSINTITTVGYGDTYPVTTIGKALGGLFSMFGTILLGLPIFCLVSNFLELWDSIREKTTSDLILEKTQNTNEESSR
eukprot:gene6411-7142_t